MGEGGGDDADADNGHGLPGVTRCTCRLDDDDGLPGVICRTTPGKVVGNGLPFIVCCALDDDGLPGACCTCTCCCACCCACCCPCPSEKCDCDFKNSDGVLAIFSALGESVVELLLTRSEFVCEFVCELELVES